MTSVLTLFLATTGTEALPRSGEIFAARDMVALASSPSLFAKNASKASTGIRDFRRLLKVEENVPWWPSQARAAPM
ncbi:MAG TPA: hypothetical protein VMG63_24340 [Terriglobia bacterium]|nr:hypothetical protein [Terriglobia bacterium]